MKPKTWRTIIGAVIAAIGLIWAAYVTRSGGSADEAKHQNTDLFPVAVHADSISGPPVANAEVDLGIADINPQNTDERGQVFFNIPKERIGATGRMTIRKEGFAAFDRQIVLRSSAQIYPIVIFTKASPEPSKEPSRSPRPQTLDTNRKANRPFVRIEYIQSAPAGPIHIEKPSGKVKGPIIWGTLTLTNVGDSPAFKIRFELKSKEDQIYLIGLSEPITLAAHEIFSKKLWLVVGDKPLGETGITFTNIPGHLFYEDAFKNSYDEKASIPIQIGGTELLPQLTMQWNR